MKRTVVNNLVKAFVMADIPLEKVDKLQKWLRENCREGGFRVRRTIFNKKN